MSEYRLNSRWIMLAVGIATIGGLLIIPVMKYYLPKAGEVNLKDPITRDPRDYLKSR